MTITDFNSDSSYLPSLTCNMDVRVHIGRSTGRSNPPMAKNGNFRFLLFQVSIVTAHIGRSPGRSTPQYTHPVAKNGNFRFLLSHIGRSTGRSTPLFQASSGQECQFQISIASHRQDQLADLPPKRHPVAKNGNCRFLLFQLIQAYQLADLTPPHTKLVKNGKYTFLLLELI